MALGFVAHYRFRRASKPKNRNKYHHHHHHLQCNHEQTESTFSPHSVHTVHISIGFYSLLLLFIIVCRSIWFAKGESICLCSASMALIAGRMSSQCVYLEIYVVYSIAACVCVCAHGICVLLLPFTLLAALVILNIYCDAWSLRPHR